MSLSGSLSDNEENDAEYPLCCFCNEPVYNRSSQAHSSCVKNPPIEWIEENYNLNHNHNYTEKEKSEEKTPTMEPTEKRMKMTDENDNENQHYNLSLSLDLSS